MVSGWSLRARHRSACSDTDGVNSFRPHDAKLQPNKQLKRRLLVSSPETAEHNEQGENLTAFSWAGKSPTPRSSDIPDERSPLQGVDGLPDDVGKRRLAQI